MYKRTYIRYYSWNFLMKIPHWASNRRLSRVTSFTVLCLIAQSCPTICSPMDCSPPGFSVMGTLQAGIPGRNLQAGLPCPPPGDLPNPGIKPRYPTLQVDSLLSELPVKPQSDQHIFNKQIEFWKGKIKLLQYIY